MKTIIIIIILISIFYILANLGEKDKKRKSNNMIYSGKMFQTLESIYLIETTKKYDIFKSRCQFLLQLSSDLIAFRQSPDYTECANFALNEYKSKYYDHTISSLQNDILNNPSLIKDIGLNDKYEVLWFKRLCEQTKQEIDSLKTKPAKEHRREGLKEIAKTVLSDLNDLTQYKDDVYKTLKEMDINVDSNFLDNISESTESNSKTIHLIITHK
jgi:hypothetical protein